MVIDNWSIAYALITLLFLFFLSYRDIKERIAPPEATYGMLTLGIVLHIIQSVIQNSINPIAYSLAGTASMFTVAYIIYRAGGWAGGDVKLFTALGAMIPLYGAISQLTHPIPYPMIILAASTIAVLPFVLMYGIYEIIKENREELKEDILSSIPRSIYSGFVLLTSLHVTETIGIHSFTAAPIAVAIYIAKEPGYPVTAFFFTLAILKSPVNSAVELIYFLALSIVVITGIKTYKSMKKNVLRENRSIEELEEGEIPAEDVWVVEGEPEKREPTITRFKGKGKLEVDSRKARGLTEEELEFLEKSRIDNIKTKKSLPFIPILTTGYVILLTLEIFI